MWWEKSKDDSKGISLDNLRNGLTTHQNGAGCRESRFVEKNKKLSFNPVKIEVFFTYSS